MGMMATPHLRTFDDDVPFVGLQLQVVQLTAEAFRDLPFVLQDGLPFPAVFQAHVVGHYHDHIPVLIQQRYAVGYGGLPIVGIQSGDALRLCLDGHQRGGTPVDSILNQVPDILVHEFFSGHT